MATGNFTVDKDNLEVVTEYVFQATPERLYKALVDPDQIAQWWGPAIYKTVVETFDLKVGGSWRIVSLGEDGGEHAFRGVFKEIDEPHRIVRTFEYEPLAGHILTETATLEDQDGGMTKLTTVAKYDNVADLTGMVSMGMESGQRESMDRLAKLVEAA
jgi:uncharacterized protein YndB with AHSA1/START domain